MKKSFVLTTLAVMLAATLLTGCYPMYAGRLVGSINLTTKDMDLAGFNAIDASSAFQVDVTQSDKFAVSVTTNDNAWDWMDVRVDGQTLRLALKPGLSINNVTLRAKVSMPKLAALDLSGASRATLTGFKSSDPLKMQLSGAGQVTSNLLQAGDMTLNLSGASRANLQGSASSLRVDASGASLADLNGFTVDKANVQLSGASRTTLDVKESLDYDISGASNLTYTGDAKNGRTQSSGASSVNHR
jgi:hypothetical protein